MAEQKLSPLAQQLLDRADAIFDKIADAASKAGEVAAEQLPDIAYQFIAYNRAYLTILIVISALLMVLSSVLIKKYLKASEGTILVPVIPMILVGFGMFTSNLKEFLMVWFAPKIFIMTEIVHLVRGAAGK